MAMFKKRILYILLLENLCYSRFIDQRDLFCLVLLLNVAKQEQNYFDRKQSYVPCVDEESRSEYLPQTAVSSRASLTVSAPLIGLTPAQG